MRIRVMLGSCLVFFALSGCAAYERYKAAQDASFQAMDVAGCKFEAFMAADSKGRLTVKDASCVSVGGFDAAICQEICPRLVGP